MTAARRPRVLLIDPVKFRRDELAEAMRFRFDVVGVGTLPEAQVAAAAEVPAAVVLSLRQTEGNGLSAAGALRSAVGPKVFLVVLGAPDGAVTAEQRQQMMKRHSVDSWSVQALDAPTLELVLSSGIRERQPPRERQAAPAAPAPKPLPGPLAAASAESSVSGRVKAFLTAPLFGTGTPANRPNGAS